MQQLQYVLQFKGRAVPKEGATSVMKASTVASSLATETIVGSDGIRATLKALPGTASFESEVTLTSESSFVESGTIRFGDNDLVHFTTVGQGYLAPSADPTLQHGTVMWKIAGGEGRFSRATGLITSNFTLSSEGEVTDNHFGVIFAG